MQDITVPVFMLSEPEEVEGFYGETIGSSAGVKELTGIFHRRGCVPAQGDMAVSSSEVVCLCYRVKKVERGIGRGDSEGDGDGDIGPGFSPFTPLSLAPSSVTTLTSVRSLADVPEPDTIIEGHLDWCERGCRSRLNGTISPTGPSYSPPFYSILLFFPILFYSISPYFFYFHLLHVCSAISRTEFYYINLIQL